MKSLLVIITALLTPLLLAAATTEETWSDNSDNEDGFTIERATGNFGGQFSEIAKVGKDIEAYRDRLLPAGTTFRYRVRAYNTAGNSGYSNTVTVSIPAGQAPITPPDDQTVAKGANTGPLDFTIKDNSADNFADLDVTVSSSNTTLVPSAGLVLGGSLGARTITVTPAPTQTGSAVIVLSVTDGINTATASFTVTVTDPLPAAPTGLTGGVIE